MVVTDAASERLRSLLSRSGAGSHGFRVDGIVGTCRGSTPMLKPADSPDGDEQEICAGDLRFFARADIAEVLKKATLDYDSRVFGRGLNLTWEHQAGGCPGCR